MNQSNRQRRGAASHFTGSYTLVIPFAWCQQRLWWLQLVWLKSLESRDTEIFSSGLLHMTAFFSAGFISNLLIRMCQRHWNCSHVRVLTAFSTTLCNLCLDSCMLPVLSTLRVSVRHNTRATTKASFTEAHCEHRRVVTILILISSRAQGRKRRSVFIILLWAQGRKRRSVFKIWLWAQGRKRRSALKVEIAWAPNLSCQLQLFWNIYTIIVR